MSSRNGQHRCYLRPASGSGQTKPHFGLQARARFKIISIKPPTTAPPYNKAPIGEGVFGLAAIRAARLSRCWRKLLQTENGGRREESESVMRVRNAENSFIISRCFRWLVDGRESTPFRYRNKTNRRLGGGNGVAAGRSPQDESLYSLFGNSSGSGSSSSSGSSCSLFTYDSALSDDGGTTQQHHERSFCQLEADDMPELTGCGVIQI